MISENKICGFGSDLLMDKEAEETVVRMGRSAIETRWDGMTMAMLFRTISLTLDYKLIEKQLEDR